MDRKCADCVFYTPIVDSMNIGYESGICHGGPPSVVATVVGNSLTYSAMWPNVPPTEYCGAFKPRQRERGADNEDAMEHTQALVDYIADLVRERLL